MATGADRFGVGYETTANTLIYSCIVLALYPDIQDEAQKDVDVEYTRSQDTTAKNLVHQSHRHNFRYLVALMVRLPCVEISFCHPSGEEIETPKPL